MTISGHEVSVDGVSVLGSEIKGKTNAGGRFDW